MTCWQRFKAWLFRPPISITSCDGERFSSYEVDEAMHKAALLLLERKGSLEDALNHVIYHGLDLKLRDSLFTVWSVHNVTVIQRAAAQLARTGCVD